MSSYHLNLEEARQHSQFDRFAKLHPAKANRTLFERLLHAMARGVLEKTKLKHVKRSLRINGTQDRTGS